MRVRHLLWGGLGVLALLVAGVAGWWWLGGAEAWLARYVLQAALDREVQIDGSVSLAPGAEPTLQLTGLRIDNPSWAEAPSLLRVERAEVQIALRPLLRGVVLLPRVALHGVRAELETAPDGRRNWQPEAAPAPAGPVRLPLLGALSVSDVGIAWRDRRDGQAIDVRIATLAGQPDPASGEIKLDASGDVNGHAFELSGASGSLELALAASAPYPLELDLRLPGIDATLKGTIADAARAAGLDLQVSLRSDSLRTAAAAWHLSVPVEAQLKGSTRVTGDLATLALRDLDADLTNFGGDRVRLAGQLGDLWQGTGLDATLVLKLDPAGDIQQLLPASWRVLDRIEASAKVAGSVTTPVFSDLSADIAGPGGSSLQLAGTLQLARAVLDGFDLNSTLSVPDPSAFADLLGFDPTVLGAVWSEARLSLADRKIEVTGLKADASTFGGLSVEGQGPVGTLAADHGLQLAPQLSLSAKMTESAPLLALADDEAPELGPITARGRLVRDDRGTRLEDLAIALGVAGGLRLDANGSLGPLVADAGVDLAVDVTWPSNQALRPLAGRHLRDLPDLGQVSGQFRLSGTFDELRIAGARLQSRRPDGIVVAATGGITSVRPGAVPALEGATFDLDAQAPSTTVVAKLFGYELPDFGAVRARGRLSQHQDKVALSAIDLSSGPPAEPSIQITGAIGDALAFEEVDLNSDFKLPTRTVLAMADLHAKAEMGQVHGKVHLSDADGTMGFDHLEAEVRETSLLSFTLGGVLGDFAEIDEVQFQTSLEVPSIADLAKAFDADAPAVGPFRFDGKLAGSRGRIDADGKATIGGTDVAGFLSGDLKGTRPRFRGQLHSPRLRLVDLGLTPLAADQAPEAGAAQGTRPLPAPARLFDDRALPLERLGALDLDLDVQVDAIEGVVLAIDQANARLTLSDGALELSPVHFGSAGGRAEMHVEIDVRAPTPAWRLRALADDAQLGEVWRELETEVPLEGELDLQLDLRAHGRSPRDLAGSLDGELGLAVQRGRIHSRLFSLTTMNPLGWLFARSTRRGYSRLDCVIARFDVRDGIAEAQTLLVDTPDATVTGTGRIDFARETIDLRMQPRAKHRSLVGLATPFTIRGDLAAPAVSVSAAGTAARMAGEVALTPVTLLGSLLSLVGDRGQDAGNPCLTFGSG